MGEAQSDGKCEGENLKVSLEIISKSEAMSEVLYRKWRPRSLSEVVGQDTVTKTLRQAVSTGRLAHAYLFCGPRGTGKTSTARILAKAVNCLDPVDGEPDNQCDRCQSIIEGRALDMIEIDAASNRGIDDIRDLSDKITFMPSEFRYKVYIVDEVHMLTEQAFNALLKTLEEPPDHAMFILATTEVHKVPLTIVSRCQRYDFRRISLEAITDKLAELSAAEEVETGRDALDLIARHSTGSLRDAENLLEQAVVSYGSPLTVDQVSDMLELSGDEDALDLCEHVVNRNVSEGLSLINRVAAQGADLRQLQRAVTEFLRVVMLTSAGAGDHSGFSDSTVARLSSLSGTADQGQVLAALRAFSEVDMRRDSSSPLPLELALMEASVDRPAAPLPQQSARPAASATAQPTGGRQASAPAAQRAYQQRPPSTPARSDAPTREPARQSTPSPAQPVRPDANGPLPDQRLAAVWPGMLRALRNTGQRFKLGPLLNSSRGFDLRDNQIIVRFAHSSHIERIREETGNPAVNRELKQVISQTLGGDYELVPELVSGEGGLNMRQANQSHLVRAAQAMGARLVQKVNIEEGVQE